MVSERIKKELKKQKKTQTWLSEQMGISFQYLHGLLKGKRRWNESTIIKAEKALNIKIFVEVV
jgi:transcriptional regulator with XRE-family HTH domain